LQECIIGIASGENAPREISQEDQKDRRSEGGKNAFFNSEDRIEKYSSEVQKPKTSLQTAGRQRDRHGSFCDSGCISAAQDLTNPERQRGQQSL
jgi:hypothetical protein